MPASAGVLQSLPKLGDFEQTAGPVKFNIYLMNSSKVRQLNKWVKMGLLLSVIHSQGSIPENSTQGGNEKGVAKKP